MGGSDRICATVTECSVIQIARISAIKQGRTAAHMLYNVSNFVHGNLDGRRELACNHFGLLTPQRLKQHRLGIKGNQFPFINCDVNLCGSIKCCCLIGWLPLSERLF
uniref:Uncharacterized protein n=1 Tax=Xenopus tropicalis TaxID=8364 RepID=A0A1B8XV16_XENTR